VFAGPPTPNPAGEPQGRAERLFLGVIVRIMYVVFGWY